MGKFEELTEKKKSRFFLIIFFFHFWSDDDMINTSNTTSTIATAKDKVLFLPGPLLNYQQQSEALASMNGIDPVRLNEVLQQIARTQRQRTSSSESEEAVNDRGVDTKSSVDRDQKSPFSGVFVFSYEGFFFFP